MDWSGSFILLDTFGVKLTQNVELPPNLLTNALMWTRANTPFGKQQVPFSNAPLASTSASSVNAALLRILCERGLSFTIYCFSVSKSVAKRKETERIEIFSHAMENFLPFALTVSQKYASKRKTENGRKVYLSFMSPQLLDCSCKCWATVVLGGGFHARTNEWTDGQTDKQTDRQMDKQTYRQMDRQTDGWTERQTNR